MKMLFFSADRVEIELVSKAFGEAGIPCETRESVLRQALLPIPRDTELWIHRDKDAYKALMLCVEQGIGFAKRAVSSNSSVPYPSWDLDLDVPPNEDEQQPQEQTRR